MSKRCDKYCVQLCMYCAMLILNDHYINDNCNDLMKIIVTLKFTQSLRPSLNQENHNICKSVNMHPVVLFNTRCSL